MCCEPVLVFSKCFEHLVTNEPPSNLKPEKQKVGCPSCHSEGSAYSPSECVLSSREPSEGDIPGSCLSPSSLLPGEEEGRTRWVIRGTDSACTLPPPPLGGPACPPKAPVPLRFSRVDYRDGHGLKTCGHHKITGL